MVQMLSCASSSPLCSYICKIHLWHTFSIFQRRTRGDGELYHAGLFCFRTYRRLQRLHEPQPFKLRTHARILEVNIKCQSVSVCSCKHSFSVYGQWKKKRKFTKSSPFFNHHEHHFFILLFKCFVVWGHSRRREACFQNRGSVGAVIPCALD